MRRITLHSTYISVNILQEGNTYEQFYSSSTARATGRLEMSRLQRNQHLHVRCAEAYGVSQERQSFPVQHLQVQRQHVAGNAHTYSDAL